MKKWMVIILPLFYHLVMSGQQDKLLPNPVYRSYVQLRGTTDFQHPLGFSLRRLKFQLLSAKDAKIHWRYKIQATFSSNRNEEFFLQDVKLGYDTGKFSLDFGQFVPQYSLQRLQPDYRIPVMERAYVINTLIPGGNSGVRDIGVQTAYHAAGKHLDSYLGIFNGNGIKEYRLNHHGYLLTHKTVIRPTWNYGEMSFGYSVMYRKAYRQFFKGILPDSVSYTGGDFRYNLFGSLKFHNVLFQSEYVYAGTETDCALGYYLLSAWRSGKSQWVAAYENFRNPNYTGLNRKALRLGYNYSIHGDEIKLSLDNYFQINKRRLEKYVFSIQFQYFLIHKH